MKLSEYDSEQSEKEIRKSLIKLMVFIIIFILGLVLFLLDFFLWNSVIGKIISSLSTLVGLIGGVAKIIDFIDEKKIIDKNEENNGGKEK